MKPLTFADITESGVIAAFDSRHGLWWEMSLNERGVVVMTSLHPNTPEGKPAERPVYGMVDKREVKSGRYLIPS